MYRLYLQRAATRAAGIALASSLYIVYTCLHYVAETVRQAARHPEPAAVAGVAATGAALLFLIVPLFLVLPLCGWGIARRATGSRSPAAGVARAATLIAVTVWVLSIAFLKFGLPACADGAGGYPSVRRVFASVQCLEN